MKDKMFAELLESVREGGAIMRGQREPSRQFALQAPGIRAIRERTSLSQSEFARDQVGRAAVKKSPIATVRGKKIPPAHIGRFQLASN